MSLGQNEIIVFAGDNTILEEAFSKRVPCPTGRESTEYTQEMTDAFIEFGIEEGLIDIVTVH